MMMMFKMTPKDVVLSTAILDCMLALEHTPEVVKYSQQIVMVGLL